MMLSNEQEKIFKFIEESNKSLFLTGKAGTGKSHLLKYFMDNTKKKVALLAPTGLAAINVGGQTINSFFQIFKDGCYEWEDIEKDISRKSFGYVNTIENLDTIVIDEVSMVRVDLFVTIDKICQKIRKNNALFGGIQLVLVGDLYQLPPVAPQNIKKYLTSKYGGVYFFMAPDLCKNMGIIRLTEIFRQSDGKFKEVLNNIRVGENLNDTLSYLNQRVYKPESMEGVVVLASTNSVVDNHNNDRLSKIEGKEYVYDAIIQGKLGKSSYPAPEQLKLKVGAQVMLLENDMDKRWVNGTVAVVSKLGKQVFVKIGKHEHEIFPKTWTSVNYKYNNSSMKLEAQDAASFTQYPIKLAWAVTIHKSQGQTYDSVYLSMDHAFDFGQTYVALSRCKDINKLYLANPLKVSDIKIDSLVREFIG